MILSKITCFSEPTNGEGMAHGLRRDDPAVKIPDFSLKSANFDRLTRIIADVCGRTKTI
jgi:hypothetical protein